MQQRDEDLYRQLKRGDQQAFAALYERYEPALFRYGLHSSGSRTLAEEVAHDVFIELISPKDRFDAAKGSLEAYLYGIARNLLRGMQRNRDGGPVEDRAGGRDPLHDLLQTESLAALSQAVRELPERYREVVIVCELQERSYGEAALILGCPVGTVRSRLHRARGLLAAKLRSREVKA